MSEQPGGPAGPESMRHILVIDDDQRLRDLLQRFLGEQGYAVTAAADAAQARRCLAGVAVDLVVLDVMMPGEDGVSFLADLRRQGWEPPVLMLTAMDAPEDRIQGLQAGADDYLPKPFEPRELLLRIENILRRAPPPAGEGGDAAVRMGSLSFDPATGELARDGEAIALSQREAALLAALARAGGEPVSREALAESGGEAISERAVDVQVMRLRRKLGDDPRRPRFLVTVRGQGYALRVDP